MIIGIASRTLMCSDSERKIVNKTYLEALKKYDNISYLSLLPTNNIEDILHCCDAFILPGGRDIDPKYYDEANTASDVDEESDSLDQSIIFHAIKFKKPLLGICRGIQSINVFMGGSLYQDIKNHANHEHQVILYNNPIYKNKFITSNSFHHQSIKKLADNFLILGVTFDNQIEIIKHESLPILGVQFHPELNDIKIFDYFINTMIKKQP